MRALKVLLTLLVLSLAAVAQSALPFSVTLNGQAAEKIESDPDYAHFKEAVAPGAKIAVVGPSGQMVIVNITSTDSKGNPSPNAEEIVLMFNAGESKSLDDNMTAQKLAPGWYTANVICSPTGAVPIMFQIK